MEIIDSLTLQIAVAAVMAAAVGVVAAIRVSGSRSPWQAPGIVEVVHRYEEALPQLLAA